MSQAERGARRLHAPARLHTLSAPRLRALADQERRPPAMDALGRVEAACEALGPRLEDGFAVQMLAALQHELAVASATVAAVERQMREAPHLPSAWRDHCLGRFRPRWEAVAALADDVRADGRLAGAQLLDLVRSHLACACGDTVASAGLEGVLARLQAAARLQLARAVSDRSALVRQPGKGAMAPAWQDPDVVRRLGAVGEVARVLEATGRGAAGSGSAAGPWADAADAAALRRAAEELAADPGGSAVAAIAARMEAVAQGRLWAVVARPPGRPSLLALLSHLRDWCVLARGDVFRAALGGGDSAAHAARPLRCGVPSLIRALSGPTDGTRGRGGEAGAGADGGASATVDDARLDAARLGVAWSSALAAAACDGAGGANLGPPADDDDDDDDVDELVGDDSAGGGVGGGADAAWVGSRRWLAPPSVQALARCLGGAVPPLLGRSPADVAAMAPLQVHSGPGTGRAAAASLLLRAAPDAAGGPSPLAGACAVVSLVGWRRSGSEGGAAGEEAAAAAACRVSRRVAVALAAEAAAVGLEEQRGAVSAAELAEGAVERLRADTGGEDSGGSGVTGRSPGAEGAHVAVLLLGPARRSGGGGEQRAGSSSGSSGIGSGIDTGSGAAAGCGWRVLVAALGAAPAGSDALPRWAVVGAGEGAAAAAWPAGSEVAIDVSMEAGGERDGGATGGRRSTHDGPSLVVRAGWEGGGRIAVRCPVKAGWSGWGVTCCAPTAYRLAGGGVGATSGAHPLPGMGCVARPVAAVLTIRSQRPGAAAGEEEGAEAAAEAAAAAAAGAGGGGAVRLRGGRQSTSCDLVTEGGPGGVGVAWVQWRGGRAAGEPPAAEVADLWMRASVEARAPWPLDLVVGRAEAAAYGALSRHLLRSRRAALLLSDTWLRLRQLQSAGALARPRLDASAKQAAHARRLLRSAGGAAPVVPGLREWCARAALTLWSLRALVAGVDALWHGSVLQPAWELLLDRVAKSRDFPAVVGAHRAFIASGVSGMLVANAEAARCVLELQQAALALHAGVLRVAQAAERCNAGADAAHLLAAAKAVDGAAPVLASAARSAAANGRALALAAEALAVAGGPGAARDAWVDFAASVARPAAQAAQRLI